MSIRDDVINMKKVAPVMAGSSIDIRNKALLLIKDSLKNNKDKIFEENKRDMDNATASGIDDAVLGRLKFDEGKLSSVLDGIDMLIGLEDPIGKVSLKRELDEDMTLTRISCPIGVIGIIFEARPDALVQISTLCVKSGNCAILKGGRETANTNRALFDIIHEAVVTAGLPDNSMKLATTHSEIDEMLNCEGYVDLIIPRGSNAFVQYIMNNTRIPVMGHADGICHIYVDEHADIDMALKIIKDAKLQYTAACNSVETILVHKSIADTFITRLKEYMIENKVCLHADDELADRYGLSRLPEKGYIEYLSPDASVKVVESLEEAVEHINTHGSHHTDSIITDCDSNAEYFMSMVDSAGVYRNCSTRFADGFRYGFGAEVGISTSKLHARGPVGLDGLVTYKYTLTGNGNIVADYAEGRRQFKYKELI